jgi:hypothetical protein
MVRRRDHVARIGKVNSYTFEAGNLELETLSRRCDDNAETDIRGILCEGFYMSLWLRTEAIRWLL